MVIHTKKKFFIATKKSFLLQRMHVPRGQLRSLAKNALRQEQHHQF